MFFKESCFRERVGGGGAWCGRESRTSNRVWCGPMSRGSNGSSILGPGDSRRRGGHSGRRSQSEREGGNRRREGGIPRIRREHWITLVARKGTAPPTMATSAITSTATAGATTAATATREGDGHCYLLDAEAGEEAVPQICASSRGVECSLVGISTKSPNLQPKKIFDPLNLR